MTNCLEVRFSRGQPAHVQVGRCSGCPSVTARDHSFPPVLARTRHAAPMQFVGVQDVLVSWPRQVRSSTVVEVRSLCAPVAVLRCCTGRARCVRTLRSASGPRASCCGQLSELASSGWLSSGMRFVVSPPSRCPPPVDRVYIRERGEDEHQEQTRAGCGHCSSRRRDRRVRPDRRGVGEHRQTGSQWAAPWLCLPDGQRALPHRRGRRRAHYRRDPHRCGKDRGMGEIHTHRLGVRDPGHPVRPPDGQRALPHRRGRRQASGHLPT